MVSGALVVEGADWNDKADGADGADVVKPKEKDGLVSAGLASVVASAGWAEGMVKEKAGFGGSLVAGCCPKREGC